MRALVQRVSGASVTVVADDGDGEGGDAGGGAGSREVVGRIGRGLCVLVGATHGDDAASAAKLAGKVWHLRVFPDEAGAMNRSAADAGLEVLVVSQFTLYADTSRGRRPSFVAAAPPEVAEPLVDAFVAELSRLGAVVATGRFRTHMEVALTNDGPVTILLEV